MNDIVMNDIVMNGNSSTDVIKLIASLSKTLGILLFDKTKCGKWKLKNVNDILDIIELEHKHVHNNLCRNIETLHNIKQYSKVNAIVDECHVIMHKLDELMNLVKKHYYKPSKLTIIEYFSTENV